MDTSNIGASNLNAKAMPLASNASKGHKMVSNDRTAGFIVSYDHLIAPSRSAPSTAVSDMATSFAPSDQYVQDDISLSPPADQVAGDKEDDFGLFDLIDMINPLQHIPVLNYAYRRITGDEIKPISSIIGGALFGGAAGAASGLVSAIVESETGKSVPETVMSFARGGLDEQMTAYNDLAPEMRAFAEVPLVKNQNYDYNV